MNRYPLITPPDIELSYETMAMVDVCRTALSQFENRCDLPDGATQQISSVCLVLGMLKCSLSELHDTLERAEKAEAKLLCA
ncbi:hypothetical protein [Microbaculum marinum]|uniref:Cell division protein ZapA n=1 Tax=Microbaculum marinum TaxID=1764581 RepID=A0AAW9RIF5_9HYPH